MKVVGLDQKLKTRRRKMSREQSDGEDSVVETLKFDAIVMSNGWDDVTVALQLLSHLEGDILNVPVLVPEAKRATQDGLVRALTEHHGSPGIQ